MSNERNAEVSYSERFLKSFKKLPARIQQKAEVVDSIFRGNIFDPRLHTHKLHGKDHEHWAYSVDNRYRIKFLFIDDHHVLCLDVGLHDEVY